MRAQNVVFERGEGAWLIAKSGERYLDFGSGVAVNALGHAHPKLVAALTEQAQKLWHSSNLYRIDNQERLAERLCQATFADKAFFCNSGAEACEGAIKLARRYHFASGHPERWRIVTFKGAFHGRTLATIAAAGNEKYLEGFGEPAPGFDLVPFNDLEAVEAAIGPETAAIMVEPIQGEGGIRVGAIQWLKDLRRLCDQHGLLLVLDEVQCGMGRTGKLFAHEWADITPDVMAVAKGIGGGFPLGVVLATDEAAKGMVAGTHGSTFGGNPLGTAVGMAVLDAILEPGFLDRVAGPGAAPQAAARARQGREPGPDRGGARKRPARRHQGQAAVGRRRQRLRGGEAAHRRCRGERRAPAAAAQRHGRRDRRGDAAACRPALRRVAKPAA